MGRTCVSARWLKRKSAGARCFVFVLELRETAWLTSTASSASPLPAASPRLRIPHLGFVVGRLGLPSVRIPGLRYRCPALFSFRDAPLPARGIADSSRTHSRGTLRPNRTVPGGEPRLPVLDAPSSPTGSPTPRFYGIGWAAEAFGMFAPHGAPAFRGSSTVEVASPSPVSESVTLR